MSLNAVSEGQPLISRAAQCGLTLVLRLGPCTGKRSRRPNSFMGWCNASPGTFEKMLWLADFYVLAAPWCSPPFSAWPCTPISGKHLKCWPLKSGADAIMKWSGQRLVDTHQRFSAKRRLNFTGDSSAAPPCRRIGVSTSTTAVDCRATRDTHAACSGRLGLEVDGAAAMLVVVNPSRTLR